MTERSGSLPPPGSKSTAEALERIADAVFTLDDEWRFTYVNRRAAELLERSEEELLGTVVWDAFPAARDSRFQREYERAVATGETVSFEALYEPLDRYLDVRAHPSESGLTVTVRDVSDRVRREKRIQERERALRRAYDVIADPDRSFPEQVDDLLGIVREALGTDYATLSRIHDDEYVFEAIDAPDDADLEPGDVTSLQTTNCERVVATERALVLEDVDADAPELASRAGNAEWGISCYLGAPVLVDGEPYGTFCFYDTTVRTEAFTDWEVTFVELLADWVGTALEQRHYVSRLAAIDELNAIVREITGAVIDQSTREEIEALACRRLADTDSYLYAWVGETTPGTADVELCTGAGAGGSVDDIVAAIGADGGSRRLTDQAYETGTTQVIQYAQTDPMYEPWHDVAAEYGFRSLAAVPIVHDGIVYGVFTVYAEREDAFEGEERSVLEHLGAILGQAIAAVERKQALVSDAVTELEFRVPDPLAEWGVQFQPVGPIVFEEVVATGDDEYRVFGTASDAALAALRDTVDGESPWESVTAIEERDDGVAFSLASSDPPVLSTVASRGGSVERAVVDDGAYSVTVHLPETVETRAVIESVRDTYADVELVSQRQIVRSERERSGITPAAAEAMTDRQWDSLRLAFLAGFYEWPRDVSGEDVAEQLGVSSATFHQHLRAAEKKLIAALFQDEAE